MSHDRIEQDLFINAPLQKVWGLVSRPAWWVGEEGPDHVEIDGNRVVATCKYGDFPVLTEKVDAPTYLACRWASSYPGEEPKEGNSTLVEFSLAPENGGTRLRVVETGFAYLNASETERRKFFEDNTQGWVQMFDYIHHQAK